MTSKPWDVYPVKPGDNRLEVSYLATQGARMESVSVAGRPGTASIGAQLGHPMYTVDLELPRGTSRTIVLHLSCSRRNIRIDILQDQETR